MTIKQLRYLLLIHQLGSINKAAQKSNISPQNISIAIKKLEEELGCPLFIRDGRKKLLLSEYGQVFIKTAEDVVASIDSAVRQLETLPKPSADRPAERIPQHPDLACAGLVQYHGHHQSFFAAIPAHPSQDHAAGDRGDPAAAAGRQCFRTIRFLFHSA